LAQTDTVVYTSQTNKKQINTMTLTERIAAITGAIAAIPKKKDPNSQVQYAFRSIDEVMNHLNPLLAKHGVSLQSQVLSHSVQRLENAYKKQFTQAIVHLSVEFTYGTEKEVWQEVAMSDDYGDKALTQAMSMAYKYAIIRKFCITTADIVKSDGDGKDPHKETNTPPPPPPQPQSVPVATFDSIVSKLNSGVLEKGADVKSVESYLKQFLPLTSVQQERFDLAVETFKTKQANATT